MVLPPAACLVFEDAPVGIDAARRAGMRTVMVPDRRLIAEELTRDADCVLESLAAFSPEKWGLPPFQ